MNLEEKELQMKIEAGKTSPEMDLDEKAYQLVFNALKKQPQFSLSDNFSDRLIATIRQRQEVKESSGDWILLTVGVVFLTVALVVAITFTGFKLSFGFLSDMADYSGLFICGVVVIATYNWIDKKVISPKINNRHSEG